MFSVGSVVGEDGGQISFCRGELAMKVREIWGKFLTQRQWNNKRISKEFIGINRGRLYPRNADSTK